MGGQEELVGQWLQGGGLLAFAAAVWWQIRESNKTLGRVLELLARLDERTGGSDEPESTPRRRIRTNPHGVRLRRPADTDDDTVPGR